MSYNEASQFSGYLGGGANIPGPGSPFANNPFQNGENGQLHGGGQQSQNEQKKMTFHGEALARDIWAERYGPWIVLGFAGLFSLFLIGMAFTGQIPGKSISLKSISDTLQFVGEGVGLFFCARIALRLHKVSNQLHRQLIQTRAMRRTPSEMADLHNEAQAAQRAFLAWAFLSCAIVLYASGQAVWTSYDARMNSADVPFPGIYDIGFVASYPFFLAGTLLLTRRNKASVGRVRLLLDALAIIGTSLALSWFFLLSPVITGLAQQPSTGAAILSIYFPTGDLFLVAVGAFLMFSPLANRAQQPVFMLLCMGLFFLAVTDSLLAYYSLSFSFNTGTLQDVLWPLSMSLIGLAAIEYPRSIAREQEQSERLKNMGLVGASHIAPTKLTQFSMTAQTIAPFILVLGTCALLLTNIAPRGGAVLVQADIVALVLILVVIARQAVTLLENNRLTMQMRGELVISRRELQVTRREADEATREAQEKQAMEEGVALLREVHARVARGDMVARAPKIAGPLLPIAISLNLMLDRISALSQRGAKYDQLINECRLLQEGIERVGQGLPPWKTDQQLPQGAAELRSIYLGLAHVQRIQESQWRRVASALESMHSLAQRIQEALKEIKQSNMFDKEANASFERMIFERVIREVDLLKQQQVNLNSLVMSVHTPKEQEKDNEALLPSRTIKPLPQTDPGRNRALPIRYSGQTTPHTYQSFHMQHMPLDE